MLTVSLSLPTQPYWLAYKGDVKVQVRPLEPILLGAARVAAMQLMKEWLDANPQADQAMRMAASEHFLGRAVGQYAIVGWEGVVVPDGRDEAGNAKTRPLEFEADRIPLLWNDVGFSRWFTDAYITSLDKLDAEGNA